MILRLLALSALAATGLATAQEATLEPKAWKKFVAEIEGGMKPAEDLEGIRVPLLHSPKLARKWGEPSLIRRSPDGGYWIQVLDPDHSFERINIVASPRPIPRLASVPPEMVTTMVNDELGEIEKPQRGRSVEVRWKSPEGRIRTTLRYFRRSSGGGADGPLDMTDAFSITLGGKTGYYVISVESVSDATEKRFRDLSLD